MSKTQSPNQNVEQLSKELARIAGLRLRPARAGESNASPAGELRSRIPLKFFHWRKCPVHGTWLQPVLKPFKHWHCEHRSPISSCCDYLTARDCNFGRPAKLRTAIERRIFAVAAFLEEHA